jgi:A/G-specific adenine glycosylase
MNKTKSSIGVSHDNLENHSTIMAQSRRNEIRRSLLEWASTNLRKYPWRQNRTPYRVLVAEVLLRRTTAQAVLRIYEDFIRIYPGTYELANADHSELEDLLKKIGLHNVRASMMIRMANYLLKKWEGQIPNSRIELMKVPLVGAYTAGAVLTLGYNIPSAIVDSNVGRIIKRLFFNTISPRPSVRVIQQIADFLAPDPNNAEYNLALIDLGALVCRYNVPLCGKCPLSSQCDTYLSTNYRFSSKCKS